MAELAKQMGEKRKIKPVVIRILVLTVFWMIVFISVNPLSSENISIRGDFVSTFGMESAGTTPVIDRGAEITQPVVIPENHWKGIDIRFGTYMRTNLSRFNLIVMDENGESLLKKNIQASTLEDNQYYHLDIPEVVESKGKKYTIRIIGGNGQKDNSPVIWVKKADNAIPAIVNGEHMDYVLDMQITCNRKWVYPAAFIAIIILSYVFVILAKRLDERAFLCLSLLLGILFIIMNPFRHPLDENTHFVKSLALSRFNLHEDIVDGNIGFNLPSSIDSFDDFYLNHHIEQLTKPYDSRLVFIGNAYSTSIIPINHMFAAFGLLIARFLCFSVGWTIWMGRLSNYLFYVFGCYLAIKNAKYYKSIFFIIASLPAALWMAASYSTDPPLLAACLLFISICLKYHFSNKKKYINYKDVAYLLGCSVCIASVKYFIYFGILCCFFLIPKDCFRKNQRRNLILTALLVFIILGIWQYRLLQKFPIVEDRNAETSFNGQIEFVFGHIVYTTGVFLNWFMNNIIPYLQSTFYSSIYGSISRFLSTMCLLSAVIAPDKYSVDYFKNRNKIRVYFIVLFLVISLLIMASLYAGFTPVGASSIAGLQPRYFQPLLILIMLPLAMTRIENHGNAFDDTMLMIVEFSLLLSLTSLLMSSML